MSKKGKSKKKVKVIEDTSNKNMMKTWKHVVLCILLLLSSVIIILLGLIINQHLTIKIDNYTMPSASRMLFAFDLYISIISTIITIKSLKRLKNNSAGNIVASIISARIGLGLAVFFGLTTIIDFQDNKKEYDYYNSEEYYQNIYEMEVKYDFQQYLVLQELTKNGSLDLETLLNSEDDTTILNKEYIDENVVYKPLSSKKVEKCDYYITLTRPSSEELKELYRINGGKESYIERENNGNYSNFDIAVEYHCNNGKYDVKTDNYQENMQTSNSIINKNTVEENTTTVAVETN